MTFNPSTYVNFVSEETAARERLFLQYMGWRDDFDIVIVGSGIGGGVLADDLADRLGSQKRILVLEAGSFIYPTHVYNICRFPNSSLAKHFGCDTFWQAGNSWNAELHRREAAAELWRPVDLLVRSDPDRAGVGARLLPVSGSGKTWRGAC